MKVGLITYAVERPAPPSITSYTLELAHALSASSSSIEVILLTTSKEGAHKLRHQFPSYHLAGCRLLPGLMTVGNLTVIAAAHALGLDIIHDPTGVSPFLMHTLSRKCATIATIHDLVSYMYPETHTLLTNFLQRVWVPASLKSATAVITVSQHSKDDVCRYLPVQQSKVTVVPCGVNVRFTPAAEDRERDRLAARYGIQQPYILYLGDIQARKNIARLLHAFASARQILPEYKLVLAGASTWKYQSIYDTVATLGLTNHVLFTGYVSDADVPALYRQASLFVFPSIYEGFGRPPLEAMACGVPVITSNVSSLPEVVGDAALTVDPYDIGALATAIEQVLADVTLREDLRRRGIARAAHFTWEHAARATLAVYERVLGKAAFATPRSSG